MLCERFPLLFVKKIDRFAKKSREQMNEQKLRYLHVNLLNLDVIHSILGAVSFLFEDFAHKGVGMIRSVWLPNERSKHDFRNLNLLRF